jgi:hypothetical protein
MMIVKLHEYRESVILLYMYFQAMPSIAGENLSCCRECGCENFTGCDFHVRVDVEGEFHFLLFQMNRNLKKQNLASLYEKQDFQRSTHSRFR